MKTPEQIAEEISLPRVISSGNTIRELMVRAIKADRAQRDPFTGRAPLIPEGNSQLGRNRIHHQNGI